MMFFGHHALRGAAPGPGADGTGTRELHDAGPDHVRKSPTRAVVTFSAQEEPASDRDLPEPARLRGSGDHPGRHRLQRQGPKVYHGTLVRGGRLALGFDDGNKIAIRSDFAGQGSAEGGLAYLATGQTTDLGVIFSTGWEPSQVENANLVIISQATAAVVLEVPWIKNISTNRYQPLGVSVMTAGENQNNYDLGATFPASNFFDANGDVDLRVYTVGLGFIGVPNYETKFEVINLDVNDPNQPNDP